jgi:hypothetical protein
MKLDSEKRDKEITALGFSCGGKVLIKKLIEFEKRFDIL